MFTLSTEILKKNLYLPIISIEVSHALSPADVKADTYRTVKVNALLDSGATSSLIDNEIAYNLGLPCFNHDKLSTVSDESVDTPMYRASLHFGDE